MSKSSGLGASDSLSETASVGGKQVDTSSVFKKDKNVLKFMKKYRYQYHVTMLPDLATLVQNTYLEGYQNGLGQHKVADENTSDGYHTFKELYEYRLLYNAAFLNELFRTHQEYGVHKSLRHSDDELCFGGGWFVVVAQLPTGQITNHYSTGEWGLFDIEERSRADKWDGHTPQDVAERLREFLETRRSVTK